MSNIIEAAYTVQPQRNLDEITAEIVTITRQTQTMILHSAIEVGRRLCEAKEQVPHGEWGDYLRDKVSFSPSSANNFMRIFKEYGSDQMPLFGDSKSQTFGNLSYSKAVALFAVPESEREQFVAENDVENISVSELKKLIAERDAELETAKKNERAARDNMDILRNQLSEARREAQESTMSEEELENIKLSIYEEAEKAAKATAAGEIDAIRQVAESEKNKLAEKVAKLDSQLKKAKAATAAEVQKAVAEEKAKAAKLEMQIAEADNADSRAAEDLQRERERVAELEKKLKLADGDATKFTVYFEDFQSCFNKLSGLVAKIEMGDADKAAKLKGALKAVLASMQERV